MKSAFICVICGQIFCVFREISCFSVESIGTLDDSLCLNIDMTSIDTELEPAGSEPKRQHAKRGNRAANIERLIAEMNEYLRASKDHYYANQNLLPRPSQAMLAKWVGIRQDDVSRCLNAPDATHLKLLWKNAENVSFILDYL
jgi:hypothetical protein